ncbi:hypothetical protein OF385_16560 [Glutamicibacter sp. JL.03c]|uniref:hypothetical protein n=1 Tax=Glutamicibacter sp. JL.03c TaxID=2984842 RepID=UPI0021F6EF9E|nr:hypothetical protein [Glutamicibacter sp. JL.03c]UYQ77603.1 hypothetical protein OF385_16560 [Glutamicibacter sp. JL.03c]
MSQPIDVGSVLSGRYQVTETVLSSAEGDLVLGGIDQVLNRSVSIMVASSENSSQLAASAREIAMGERASNVQVLDLGITDSNQTYLVANVARSSDLLDLVLESDDAPYVEPFFTDTLGTEIFGESRQAVPETYEYEDEEPEHQHKLGTAFSSGLAGLKNRFGKKNQEQAEAQQFDQTAPHEQVPATTATPVTPAEQPATQDQPAVSRLDDEDDEPNVTATAALAAAAQSKGDTPAKAKPEQGAKEQSSKAEPEEKPAPNEQKPAKKKGGAAAAGAAAGAAVAAGGAKASTFPAAAKNVPAQGAAAPVADEEVDENTSKGTRLLVGAVLLIVLVLAVVFAFNFLGGDKDTTANDSGEKTEASQPAESESPKESTEPALPKPEISDVSRLVPGNQQLNAETDGTLSNMIDGNASSAYNTYTYTTSNFGGFASNMVFILELEDKSAISEVNLDGLNATGGDYEILVGDSDDLGDANSVAKGSFSGPSVSVTVKDGDKDSMEGSYVFLNVTDLPRKASGGNESRPYGLQIGEFSAK